MNRQVDRSKAHCPAVFLTVFFPAVLLLAVCCLPAGGAEVTRPNVVLIFADDLAQNALGCYGRSGDGRADAKTPNLDRLAKQGMRFTSAYADSQCSPTRAALLSGQYGARTKLHKVIGERDPQNPPMLAPPAAEAIGPDLADLARTLRKAGYATGMSGKWHIADEYDAATLKKKRGEAYFDAYGFDFVGDAKPLPAKATSAKAAAESDKQVDPITDDLLGFIERNKDRRFFAYFSHHAVHTPIEAKETLVQKYVDLGYPKSSTPEAVADERPSADYLAMIDHLDASVGRVMARLDELRLTDRTMVVFYSDNGGLGRATDSLPFREGKGSAYEGGIRVPLIVRWPGVVPAGSTCDVPVHAIDFYPTFAELAGGPAEAAPVAGAHPLDGVSFVPLLKGGSALDRPAIYWHMPTYTPAFGRTPCSAVRKGDWKLIHYFGDTLDTTGQLPISKSLYGKLKLGSRTELYNLAKDAGEQHECSGDHPEKVKELMSDLRAWWKETDAGIPKENPKFDPNDASWWETPRPVKKK